MRRAARRFAKRLPGYLARNWGRAETYTEPQVAAALRYFALDGSFVSLAYAAFLSEPDYLAMVGRLPRALPYDLARFEFERARPWPPRSWDPDKGLGLVSGGECGDVGGGYGHSGH